LQAINDEAGLAVGEGVTVGVKTGGGIKVGDDIIEAMPTSTIITIDKMNQRISGLENKDGEDVLSLSGL
jgi:hypothetical protein